MPTVPPAEARTQQIETSLDPHALLALLKHVEEEVGRTPTFRNGPRVLDLDLIFYDDRIYDSRKGANEGMELIIPHERVHEREFVLRPLAEYVPKRSSTPVWRSD